MASSKNQRSVSRDVSGLSDMSPSQPGMNVPSMMLIKPKCADIFIDLLLNDQLFKIKDLVKIACENLMIISEGIYNSKQTFSPREVTSARDAPRYNDQSGIEDLNQSSAAVREHLLKRPYLKKLIKIHQQLRQSGDTEN